MRASLNEKPSSKETMPVVVAVYDDGEGVVKAHVAGRCAQQYSPGSQVPRQYGVSYKNKIIASSICELPSVYYL